MAAIESVLARGRARSIFRGGRPGAAVVAGLLILAAAALSPASAAVTCADAWERGTLDASGTWRAGAGNDNRVACTADMDGDALMRGDLPAFPDGARKFVIDVSDGNIDRVEDSDADAQSRHLVLTGSLDPASGDAAVDIEITGFATGHEDAMLMFESFATIDASGRGNDGIKVDNTASTHTGTIVVINRGMIDTSGDRFARGMDVRSQSSSVRAENAGTIATTGAAGRGVFAEVRTESAGTATAINKGTITTEGGVAATSTPVFHIASDGVRAVHNGAGAAKAENAAGGTVTVTGAGARGVGAFANGAGAAEAENAGTVVTRGGAFVMGTTGFRADGVFAVSKEGDATAKNAAGGSVATHGVAAFGMGARANGGGTAKVTNAGTVDTHATASRASLPGMDGATGARGLWASSATGDATVENESTGAVTTRGARGFGAIAVIANDGSAGKATAKVDNRGTVTTEGLNADAAISLATHGGTAANPNEARAYNHEGATIATTGDGSGGLGAAIQGEGGEAAFGSAYARNDGTIATSGGRPMGTTGGGDGAWGMNASFFTNDDTAITGAGDVEAVNTGTITASGLGAHGIRAVTYGSGAATVLVDGGTVRAMHDAAADADDGVGIRAASGTGGSVTVTIEDRAEIEAIQAMRLTGAPATVTVTDSAVTGRVSFGAAADSLTVENSVLRGAIATGGGNDTIRAYGAVTMEGDIDFGAGDDELILDVTGASVLRGNITGLETLNKMCPGDFTIDGNVTFAGSSVVVSEGGLVITGHLNIGTRTSDTLTVKDGARLTALLTETGTPRISAGRTTVEEGGRVLVQAHEDVETVDAEQAITTFLTGSNVVLQGAEPLPVHTQDGDGEPTMLAAYSADGTVTLLDGAEVGTRAQDAFLDDDDVRAQPVASRGGGGGGSDDTAAFVIGGASLLALLYAVWDWDELMSVSPATLNPALVRTVDRPSGLWVRSLAESLPRRGAGAASGTEIGVDFAVGGGFVLGVSAVPDAAVDHASAGADATTFAGGRYTLKGGWRGEALFGGLKLSQARWGVDSAYRNPTVGGGLRSRYRASQTDAQASLGARFDLGAGLALTPLAGAFAGAVKHGAHRAEGPVFDAAMPEVVQRYGGWRIGLGLASEWRNGPGNLKLRPSLKLSAARVWTDSPEFTLRQSDRLGILSTATRARLPAAPGTVLGVATGLDTIAADGVRLGVGYGGLAMDGKLVHAAFARAKITF